MKRRSMIVGAAIGGPALWLGGCAAMNQVSAEVSTFGEWPAARRGASFAFERLPSQQQSPEVQQHLEGAAGLALQKHGFRPVAGNAEPDVLVQLGARITRTDRSPWDDPLWWHGGFGRWRHGPWRGPYWSLGASWRYESPRYDREVALLIRDRVSGKPLYEARASSEGNYGSVESLLKPLFDAALYDFPAVGVVNPRRVTVPLS
ncbi:DUF4136 domain-containing protein [Aquincola sp. S2]|uniref:DUF4136 domain-containing protein n=1 Tax=Pseudaquabacterium terrae TaxID=2732868 RepID=A0ABX2EC23_9BURK|nr:DUF4136 domain-containing protein [Aquabacterium terrae]NRF66711.1 DUF4136 domain-containing protein [Aquabacterium terrae]